MSAEPPYSENPRPLDPPPGGGRLAVLTALAVASRAIPLPFLPDRVLLHVRGAVLHDCTSRLGLSLTAEAREVLAAPASEGRTVTRTLAEAVAHRLLRRLGPIARLTSGVRALEVFALGHLLERYFRESRPRGTLRIELTEARKLRQTIDSAVLKAFSPSLSTYPLQFPTPSEDLRDAFTRWIDTALLTGASLPGYVERRLDAAFDAVLSEAPELRRG